MHRVFIFRSTQQKEREWLPSDGPVRVLLVVLCSEPEQSPSPRPSVLLRRDDVLGRGELVQGSNLEKRRSGISVLPPRSGFSRFTLLGGDRQGADIHPRPCRA